MNRTLPEPARDVALLIARLLLGTIMFAHGYQKLMIDGIGRTTEGFESMSIPVAIFSAAFVTVVEVVGGVLVALGALVTVVAACYLVVMVGAAVFVHIGNGIFVSDGGWELVGAIAAVLLALASAGSGRFGVDHLIRARHRPSAAVTPAAPESSPPGRPSSPATRHDYVARAASFADDAASTEVTAVTLPVRRDRPRSWPTPSSRSATRSAARPSRAPSGPPVPSSMPQPAPNQQA